MHIALIELVFELVSILLVLMYRVYSLFYRHLHLLRKRILLLRELLVLELLSGRIRLLSIRGLGQCFPVMAIISSTWFTMTMKT